MANKVTDEERKQMLTEIIGARYLPTRSIAECEDMLTTDDLHELVERHSPGAVPLRLMRRFMQELGYTETLIGTEYRWLMRSPA